MAKKYYAVKKGNMPGVYKTWNECKAQVDGYSGAVYKSFPSMEEAKLFASIDNVTKSMGKNSLNDKSTTDKNKNFDKVIAYVDGSYNNTIKVYSGGSVILYKDEIYEIAKVGKDSNLVDMRNVAGELLGVKNVINWILDNNLKNISVEIHYDYEGIERWANYEWKANKEGTKDYQKFIDSFRALGHELTFVKVKAHSGIFYNEEADRLAGEAISNYQAKLQLVNEKDSILKKDSRDTTMETESEYRVLFEKVFGKEIDVDDKFQITYGSYKLSERSIKKFIKNTWKSKGYLIKDIEGIRIVLDVENQIIKWYITDIRGDITADEHKM
ncbi:MAG: ribonuclease H family protein [Acidaminobacteraceae bacterium]